MHKGRFFMTTQEIRSVKKCMSEGFRKYLRFVQCLLDRVALYENQQSKKHFLWSSHCEEILMI